MTKDSQNIAFISQGRFNLQKITGLYPETVIQKLCQVRNIPHDKHACNLFQTLDGAAQWYRTIAKNGATKLTAPEIKKYLTNMSKALNMLTAKMNDMPEQVADAFYDTLSSIEEERIQNTPDGDDIGLLIDPTGIQQALEELQLICDTALSDLTPGKEGRPKNNALYCWVEKISNFWVHDLKRSYRVDGYKGAVITDAGNFLTDCLKPLDPGAIDLLYSQMRRYRDQLNRQAA